LKDVDAMLRRIDAEILRNRQQIRFYQSEITRLQDSRLVLQDLVEHDQNSAREAREERQGVISGEYAKPVLIVRKVGTGDEEGSASQAAKSGGEPLNKSGNRRGLAAPKKRTPPKMGSHRKQHKDGIVRVLKNNGQSTFDVEGLIDRLGVGPLHGRARQPIYQALYELKKAGIVTSPHTGAYQMARGAEVANGVAG
jgi:hypothetical protein